MMMLRHDDHTNLQSERVRRPGRKGRLVIHYPTLNLSIPSIQPSWLPGMNNFPSFLNLSSNLLHMSQSFKRLQMVRVVQVKLACCRASD